MRPNQLALKSLLPEKETVAKSALAIAAASVGAVALASVFRGHRISYGLGVLTRGLPWLRPRRRFGFRRGSEARRLGLIAGHVVLGSVLLAGLEGTTGDKLTKSRLGRGVLTSLSAYALQRLFLGRRLLDPLNRAIGVSGTAFTYGAIGAAYAMTSNPKSFAEPDPSGGDISAGVPAM